MKINDMQKRTIDVYNCDHCNKMYQRKHACEQHEKDCFKNPINHRPCLDCMNLTMIEQTIYGNDWTGGETQTKVNAFFCRAKGIALYPPKTENRNDGRVYEFGDYANEPMPKTCDQADIIFPQDEPPLF
jgi:hypothetical protein